LGSAGFGDVGFAGFAAGAGALFGGAFRDEDDEEDVGFFC
jgi:hypothetical protein